MEGMGIGNAEYLGIISTQHRAAPLTLTLLGLCGLCSTCDNVSDKNILPCFTPIRRNKVWHFIKTFL